MKLSLISATSIFALFSAAVGPAHAATLSTATAQLNIYDLVHDGATSSDGGDRTVTSQDPLITARMALEAASSHWQSPGFTGPMDPITDDNGYPTVPLGAAPGTQPDNDLASSVVTPGPENTALRARAIGQARVAALVGTVGDGARVDAKSGSTVFVAVGSTATFNDTGTDMASRGASGDYAFAPSSSSTATITVAGAGNIPRRGFDGGFTVAAANSLQVVPTVTKDAAPSMAQSDTAQPILSYNYTPAKPVAGATAVAAVFPNAVTANGTTTGMVARVFSPTPAKIQTSEATLGVNKLIGLSDASQDQPKGTQGDGTRTFISASVSVNPSVSAARYMAEAVNATRTIPAGQTVEAFEVGPSAAGAKAAPGRGTTVAEPLRGKVMASIGALNNRLALP